jgi:hypothetical protein
MKAQNKTEPDTLARARASALKAHHAIAKCQNHAQNALRHDEAHSESILIKFNLCVAKALYEDSLNVGRGCLIADPKTGDLVDADCKTGKVLR